MTPPRLRTAVGPVLAAVLALGAVSCGDPEKSYCAALSADQELFAAMADDTSGLALLKHRSTLHQLGDKAPSDLTDEWQTFLGAIDAFDQTLHETGVKPDEFVDGQAPATLSPEVRTRIVNAANELSSDDVVQAADAIEQQAKDVCKLQLGL
jgi:hypothetical protein